MLVVSRKENEGILIGDNVRVVLLRGRDGSARIGIDAPRDVIIARDELIEKSDEESEGKNVDGKAA